MLLLWSIGQSLKPLNARFQAYSNLQTTLAHFDGSLGDLVELPVFVGDIEAYTAAAALVRPTFFGSDGLPASALVSVSESCYRRCSSC